MSDRPMDDGARPCAGVDEEACAGRASQGLHQRGGPGTCGRIVRRAVATLLGDGSASAPGRAGRRGYGDADADAGLAAMLHLAPPRLHSAVVTHDDGNVRTVAFYAAIVTTPFQLARSLRAADPDFDAVIDARLGFDPGHPLLSAPLVELLNRVNPVAEGDWLNLVVRLDRPSARVGAVDDGVSS